MLKKIVKFGILFIERLFRKTIVASIQMSNFRIKVHPKAVNDGSGMLFYSNLVKMHCVENPKNIFEIGANYAQDAEFLRQSFSVDPRNVYCFEPHPQIYSEMKNLYGFNAYELAISNKNGRAKFNAINVNTNQYNNSGISSLRKNLIADKNNFIEVDVEMIRMDDFMLKNNIDSIDFLKLDVEGMNYEVLDGFGDYLQKIKIIQVEAEYEEYWDGQKLYEDIEILLKKNGFKLLHFVITGGSVQSDSLWIHKDYLKKLNK